MKLKPLTPTQIDEYYKSTFDELRKITCIDFDNLVESLAKLPIKLSGSPKKPNVYYGSLKFTFILDDRPEKSVVRVFYINQHGKEESICTLTLSQTEVKKAKELFTPLLEKYQRLVDALTILQKITHQPYDVDKIKADIKVISK